MSLSGRYAAIANRDGGISVIAARDEYCFDADSSGTIETSTGPGDVLAWGTDECVLWNKNLPGTGTSGPRAVAWNIGDRDEETCIYERGDVWVGWGEGTTAKMRLLRGQDGATLVDASAADLITGANSAYGGAIDADNNFWVTGSTRGGKLVKVAPDGTTTIYPNPNPTYMSDNGVHQYGMALDPQGNPVVVTFISQQMFRFDATTETWGNALSGFTSNRLRGMTVDADGQAWVAMNEPCALALVDTTAMTFTDTDIEIPGCSEPVGVSIDAEGYVWIVDKGSNSAFKMDPETLTIEEVTGLDGPYTYSDMTGAGLALQVQPQ